MMMSEVQEGDVTDGATAASSGERRRPDLIALAGPCRCMANTRARSGPGPIETRLELAWK